MHDLEHRSTPPPNRLPVFNLGFRPFFLGAAGFAVLSIAVWAGVYGFGWPMNLGPIPPLFWHGHEMVYGYTSAVIAGFLLTAVKNWTQIQTPYGARLAGLFSLWLAARLIPFCGLPAGVTWMAIADLLFLALLFVSVAGPIVKTRQKRQALILLVLLLYSSGNALFYLGLLGRYPAGLRTGLYLGLYMVIGLILIFSRRVFPFFAKGSLGKEVDLRNPLWLDLALLVVFLPFAILDALSLHPDLVSGCAAMLAILSALRLWNWHTPGLWTKPLLWVLYLGSGCITLGFALKAAAFFLPAAHLFSVHAFAYGGIGMVTIGMMARVALGHTGRNVQGPPPILFLVFALFPVGLIFRIALPWLLPDLYRLWILFAQGIWVAAFTIFLVIYTPILLKPRIDGKWG